jgi:carboxypeptidase Q
VLRNLRREGFEEIGLITQRSYINGQSEAVQRRTPSNVLSATADVLGLNRCIRSGGLENMNRRGLVGFLVLCGVIASRSWAQSATQNEPGATDKRILQEIQQRNHLMENIEYLSDMIGRRLTGSDGLKAAEIWAASIARQYGLENVHLEGWKIAHSWQRGAAEAQVVEPVSRRMTIASAGWSPSTNGTVRGTLAYVAATNREELQTYKVKLKGSILILYQPSELVSQEPTNGPYSGPEIQAPGLPGSRTPSEEQKFREDRKAFLKNEGVAALLYDSGRHNGLLSVSNVADDFESRDALPTAMLTHEDYSLLWRLVQKGTVKIEINLSNSFSDAPVEVHNVVGEIRGGEKPDEVVILCAHLDSWDLASGSTDDGTGVVAVLEAMRAIQAAGSRPKRTIRFVLFTGEEQGEVGSREYVKQHRDEWPRISAVLADDTGTSRILTLRLHQNYAARQTVDATLAPLEELGLVQPWMERYHGSDYAQFNDVGVPGFSLIGNQTDLDYDQTHHTQADTFDKVNEGGIVHQAQVLAGWAYNTAQLPELLPRTWKVE